MPQVAALLRPGGVNASPIKKHSKKYVSNQSRSVNVKKTNDVKTTAALLRATEKTKNWRTIERILLFPIRTRKKKRRFDKKPVWKTWLIKYK